MTKHVEQQVIQKTARLESATRAGLTQRHGFGLLGRLPATCAITMQENYFARIYVQDALENCLCKFRVTFSTLATFSAFGFTAPAILNCQFVLQYVQKMY